MLRRALAALALLALASAPALAANQNPLPDGVCETTTTTGTGTLTLAGALQNYRTFASAVTSGNSVKYSIVTGSGVSRKTENGEGVFTSPSTLTRSPAWSSDGVATALSLSGTSNVCVTWNSGWATEGDWGINAEKLAGTTPGAGGLSVLDDADAAAIRTTLALVPGTNVQAFDADLSTIAGLTATTDNFMVGSSGAWTVETPAQAQISLCGADPNADRITFWDDSVGACGYLTPPTNFIISGTSATIREAIVVALSDESSTLLTTGTGKAAFNMPYAFTLTSVRCSVTTVQTAGSLLTFNIKENGTTILSTNITIDNSETSSATAATPPVISDTALADNSVISFDIVTVGTAAAKGAKCYLIGNQ